MGEVIRMCDYQKDKVVYLNRIANRGYVPTGSELAGVAESYHYHQALIDHAKQGGPEMPSGCS